MAASSSETVADGFRLPESLRWHDGRLWMSDMDGGAVYVIEEHGARRVCDVPAHPSGLGWDLDGRLLIVSQLDHRLLRQVDGDLRLFADLAPALLSQGGDVRPNDMFVDDEGIAYVGSLHFVERDGNLLADDGRPTPLLQVTPDGDVTVLSPDLLHPNGIVKSTDDILIVAETRAARLTEVSLDGSSPGAARPRTSLRGGPDGLCLAEDGAVWVALPWIGVVQRVGASGSIEAEIDLRPRVPLDCALGGVDRTTLFVANVEYIDHLGSSRTGRVDAFALPDDI
jgi:sugar lactone lactonase YvrE